MAKLARRLGGPLFPRSGAIALAPAGTAFLPYQLKQSAGTHSESSGVCATQGGLAPSWGWRPAVRCGRLGVGAWFAWSVWCTSAWASQGFDTGQAAETRPLEVLPMETSWARLRGLAGDAAAHSALKRWEQAGWRPLVYLRWSAASWKSGVRNTGHRFSLDLREAYSRSRKLAEAASSASVRWEIDNEPDIGFCDELPETYAAFFKAVALGVQAGSQKKPEGATFGKQWFLTRVAPKRELESEHRLAIIAPLALPPGPYFERWMANRILAYSGGANFHYYGYAEDFFGVYRQFQAAAEEVPTWTRKRRVGDIVPYLKELPVFVTEYGYGLLSEPAAATTEGRVRQWRWFKSVGEQTRVLRLEGPMAFYLPPYLEHGTQEFGLTMKGAGALGSTVDRPPSTTHSSAGGVRFQAADFGATQPEPWMKSIGRKIGDNEASPALAWLLAQPAPTAPSLSWRARIEPASPIVIDFIADDGAAAVKALFGYGLTGGPGGESRGAGRLRIYNFSDRRIEGRLDLGGWATSAASGTEPLTVHPGEMREIPVTLSLMSGEFRSFEWTVRFAPAAKEIGTSVFSTLLYPDARSMTRREVARLDGAEAGVGNARTLDARPLATEESPETASGRWRVTDGLTVSERNGIWSFSVTGYPVEPLRPAIAELILPDEFVLPENSLFECDYRLAPRPESMLRQVAEPRVPLASSSATQAAFGIYWRTANGNLYTVWQTPPATTLWRRYAQAKASYTMGFFGRANLPWRFADNKPVALVFQFRPNYLPVTFEVKNASVTQYSR